MKIEERLQNGFQKQYIETANTLYIGKIDLEVPNAPFSAAAPLGMNTVSKINKKSKGTPISLLTLLSSSFLTTELNPHPSSENSNNSLYLGSKFKTQQQTLSAYFYYL